MSPAQGVACADARSLGTLVATRVGRATQGPLMIEVNRVQTGVRMEASLLKVLKGLAAYTNLGLGDLLEGICLHALEGKQPFSRDTLEQIGRLKQIYGLTLTAADSHQLLETGTPSGTPSGTPAGKPTRASPKR